ncbi:ribose 5-phosphate isomerase B [Chondrinema litorale]|uniref:ribose 5-phosphate isomerase B n=1 Tax=Chondrinema litorale TaxID=2994555 RepID=UPI002544143E|nr:ribose 5-phosphate isomerase B [Chondrinema litorale]UZR94232.1 ribose 5-phosphate isomerase B [Chondrinema litorale]
MKIAIGADHAGYDLKEIVKPILQEKGYEFEDFGTNSTESTDYPDYAHPVANAVESADCDFGILICGTGNGVAITANKHQKIRAGLCWTPEIASLIRQHNDANVLCIPSRFISTEAALEILDTFLKTEFEGGRHGRRIGKMACM